MDNSVKDSEGLSRLLCECNGDVMAYQRQSYAKWPR